MQIVLRVVDKLKIEFRGTLYKVIDELSSGTIYVGDTFYDLNRNMFVLKNIDCVGDYIFIQLFNASGLEVQGSVLLSDFNVNWIFCSHPLYKNEVDDDYKEEYEACKNKYNCCLFSYEDLEQGKLSLYGNINAGLTIYRGWMMKPEVYGIFYSLLKKRNIVLINTPEEYTRYHTLPGWYNDFYEYTAKSVWTTNRDINGIEELLKNFNGSVIVKDYVKSRKHEWYDACFIPDVNNIDNVHNVVYNFVSRQGDDLVGGIVFRQFIKLRSIGYHEKSGMPISEEYRVFVVANKVIAIGGYWGKEISLNDDEIKFIEKIAVLVKSNFISVDFARCDDGSLMILEFGDGQVSGLQTLRPENLYVI